MADETFRWVVAGGVAIATLSMFTMAVVTVVMLRVISRLQDRLEGVADRAEPVVDSVRHLIAENGPKVGAIMTAAQETAVNAKDVSIVVREEAKRFAEVGDDFAKAGKDFAEVGRDLAARTRIKVAQVDAAVDETVAQVQNFGDNVRLGVMKPVHEVSGVLAGIRAGVSAYTRGRRPNVSRATQDEEMFI